MAEDTAQANVKLFVEIEENEGEDLETTVTKFMTLLDDVLVEHGMPRGSFKLKEIRDKDGELVRNFDPELLG